MKISSVFRCAKLIEAPFKIQKIHMNAIINPFLPIKMLKTMCPYFCVGLSHSIPINHTEVFYCNLPVQGVWPLLQSSVLIVYCWCTSNGYDIFVHTLALPLLHWPPPFVNVRFCVCVCANSLQPKAGASSKAAAGLTNHNPSEKCCLAPYLLLTALLSCHLSLWQPLFSILDLIQIMHLFYLLYF